MPLDVVGPKVGDVGPDFTLPEVSGGSVHLVELRGQPVVLVFYRGSW
jgi:peroxiredoxin